MDEQIIYGRNAVTEALLSGKTVDTVYIQKNAKGLGKIISLAKDSGAVVKDANEEKLSKLSGLPIFATTATAEVAAELDGKLPNVIPLKLQEKYFDLPSQKPGNRPLWG